MKALGAALLLLSACATVGPHVTVERHEGITRRKPIEPWRVQIHTRDTGPIARPHSVRGKLTVRAHENVAFGFGYLRVLRREAAELGCDAIVVGEPTFESIFNDNDTTRWDATCVAFSSPSAAR